MAQQVITHLVDDVTGEEADETVRFGLDGKHYVIDLSEANAKELRGALAGYIESGRIDRPGKTTAPKSAAPKAAGRRDTEQSLAIRDWARANKMSVADRGRIPAAVIAAFNAAH
jgi:hypothetical protein